MLAYSATANYECLVSELMKCSLLDVFKAHIIQGSHMGRKNQVVYATQLALGMTYLHTCNPPIIHRDVSPDHMHFVSIR
jgi:serine/threonine protein kinase